MQEEAWLPLPNKKKITGHELLRVVKMNISRRRTIFQSTELSTLKGFRNWIFSLLSHISLIHDKTILVHNQQ